MYRRTAVCSILLGPVALAQLYIHDSQRDKEAQNAKQQFAAATTGDASIFPTMLSNLNAVEARNLALLEQLNRTSVGEFLNLLPQKTWSELLTDVRKLQPKFLQSRAQSLAKLNELADRIPLEKSNEKDLEKRLGEIQDRLDAKTVENAKARPKLQDFENQIQKLKLTGDKPDIAALQQVISSVSALGQLQSLLTALTAKPPGLQIVMLDAAVELQKVDIDRSQADLAFYQDELKLERTRIRDQQRITGRGTIDATGDLMGPGFGTVLSQIRPGTSNGFNSFCAPQDEEVANTLRRLSDLAAREPGAPATVADLNCTPSTAIKPGSQYRSRLRNLVDALEIVVSMKGYETYLDEAATIERSTEQQRHAIRLSAINAGGRAVLISHGLEGLAQYYAGGWTADDTANLFRALQTVAQGVGAGRLK